MKPIELLRALNDVDDRYIAESARPRQNTAGAGKRRNILVFAACAAALLIVSFAGIRSLLRPSVSVPESALIAGNPVTECETMDEAQALTGFRLEYPDSIAGWEMSYITVMNGRTVSVAYTDGSGLRRALLSKWAGTEDLSGDFNSYDSTGTVTVRETQVLLKSAGDSVGAASWNDGSFSYYLMLDPGPDREAVLEILDGILRINR